MIEDHARNLLAGHPVRDLHLHLLGDRRLQPMLNDEAEDHRRDQEDEVDTEVSHGCDGTKPESPDGSPRRGLVRNAQDGVAS